MPKKQKPDTSNIEEGMIVEATEGDLGENDVSKPKVSEVVHDEQGNVEKVIVTKGVLFKKKLEVPADRVTAVDQPEDNTASKGAVAIEATESETAALSATGEESLAAENQDGLLDQLEQDLPTAEGLREIEEDNVVRDRKAKRNFLLHVLGPGFLGGMAGNDASAVTSYAVDGATNGYGHLWLLLLSTPLYQAVQFTCAKIGRITQQGLAEILRKHYSGWIAIPA